MEFKVGDKVKMKSTCSSCEYGKVYELVKYNGALFAKGPNYPKEMCNCQNNWELIEEHKDYQVGDVVMMEMAGKEKLIVKIGKDDSVILSSNNSRETRWEMGWKLDDFNSNYFNGYSWKCKKLTESIDHFQYKNPKYFPRVHIYTAPLGFELYRQEYTGEFNQSNKPSLKEKTMNKLSQLSGKVRRAMSPEAKTLYQAGYQDEKGNWTNKAIDVAEDILLKEKCDSMKAEFLEMAKEELDLEKQEKE